jgi:hypothetical protein
MNRIFISYRTSDAKKDAHRLAVDLEAVFGDEQVFFDKHDLQGGAAWRDSIGQALGQRPVVLLLMTPELIGAAHPEGGRRIDRDDDPIRNELVAAAAHGALVVPLLTEGMTMPGRTTLPHDLHFLSEAHALKLRTDDWAHDLGRLVGDLVRQGIQPRAGAAPAAPAAAAGAGDLGAVWVVFWIAVVLLLVCLAGAGDNPDADTYLGVAALSLIPLGMFIYAFRRFAAAGRAMRWVALALAVFVGLVTLGATSQWIDLETGQAGHGPATSSLYRPPVTSMTAPVV